MIDKFESLLKLLSNKFNTDLKIDQNQSCLISFDDTVNVQFELDEALENLIIFSPIAQLPPGKFRENVLLNALKENDKFPYLAVFGYLEKTNSLAIYNLLNFSSLDNETLYSFINAFVELAFLYHDAVLQGNSSPLLG
jgi:hypothetical protein